MAAGLPLTPFDGADRLTLPPDVDQQMIPGVTETHHGHLAEVDPEQLEVARWHLLRVAAEPRLADVVRHFQGPPGELGVAGPHVRILRPGVDGHPRVTTQIRE